MRPLARAQLLLLLLLLPPLALPAAACAPDAPVSARRSLVWGPGLQAAVAVPVRYFYLQAVGSDGRNLTRSPPGSVQLPRPEGASRILRWPVGRSGRPRCPPGRKGPKG